MLGFDIPLIQMLQAFEQDPVERISHELRAQLENEMKKDGDTSLATWIKRVLRKELVSRGVDPEG